MFLFDNDRDEVHHPVDLVSVEVPFAALRGVRTRVDLGSSFDVDPLQSPLAECKTRTQRTWY